MASVKVGVLLSGCGFKDGAEIHESVLTLLALDRAGAEVRCFAPDVDAGRGRRSPAREAGARGAAQRAGGGGPHRARPDRGRAPGAREGPRRARPARRVRRGEQPLHGRHEGGEGRGGRRGREAPARDARREEAHRGDLHRAARGGEGPGLRAPPADRRRRRGRRGGDGGVRRDDGEVRRRRRRRGPREPDRLHPGLHARGPRSATWRRASSGAWPRCSRSSPGPGATRGLPAGSR